MWFKVCPFLNLTWTKDSLKIISLLEGKSIEFEKLESVDFCLQNKNFSSLHPWMHGWIFKIQVKNGGELEEVLNRLMTLAQTPSTWKNQTLSISNCFLPKVGSTALNKSCNFSCTYMGCKYYGFNPTYLPSTWQDLIHLYSKILYIYMDQ